MSPNNSNEENKYINLSNIPSLITFAIFLGVVFSVLRYHFYFQVLLHVPIFQFMDSSEFILVAASSGTIWIIYLGGINLPSFIMKQDGFNLKEKIVAILLILSITFLYFFLIYKNDPVFKELVLWPFHTKILMVAGILIIAILVAMLFANKPIFFKRNPLIVPIAISIWYALFEGWINYKVVVSNLKMNNITVKSKSLGVISTNDTIVNAGRTRNYLFYYNRYTHKTKVVKADDIEEIDIDSEK